MATYTREEFVRQVLIDLRVIGATEAPDAEDYELVNQRVQQKFEELYEEGLIPFDLDGAVPARYFGPLRSIACAQLYTAYSRNSDAPMYEGKATDGRKQLWKLRQRANFSSTTKATYF